MKKKIVVKVCEKIVALYLCGFFFFLCVEILRVFSFFCNAIFLRILCSLVYVRNVGCRGGAFRVRGWVNSVSCK